MTAPKKKTFYWRAFVTFYIILSFVVLALSGIVLYIAPPGRIANWSPWSIAFLDKARWQAVHTILAFLFVTAAAFHIYFNWRVIIGYLKAKLSEGIRRKWELAAAAGAMAALLALTIGGVPPFQTVMDVGEDIKNSWSTLASEPPVPHAEDWTLAKFAETTKVPVDQAVVNLTKAGYSVANGEKSTLKQIAQAAGVTPREVYTKAKGAVPAPSIPAAEGGGWGRRSVRQVAEQIPVPLSDALGRLKGKGVDASADSNIREIAQRAGLTPLDVVKLIQGPSADPLPAGTRHDPAAKNSGRE